MGRQPPPALRAISSQSGCDPSPGSSVATMYSMTVRLPVLSLGLLCIDHEHLNIILFGTAALTARQCVNLRPHPERFPPYCEDLHRAGVPPLRREMRTMSRARAMDPGRCIPVGTPSHVSAPRIGSRAPRRVRCTGQIVLAHGLFNHGSPPPPARVQTTTTSRSPSQRSRRTQVGAHHPPSAARGGRVPRPTSVP